MRRLILLVVLLLAALAIWYGAWRFFMAGDVAQVSASIAHHNQEFKRGNRYVVLKADDVMPAGFPFRSHVRMVRPTLSMIFNKETYAVSLPYAQLMKTDAGQGRYRVTLPAEFEALYAVDGSAPENYRVTMQPVPELLVRAQGNSLQCSGLPGSKPCADTAEEAPFQTYAAALPASITLHMELNGESRDAAFAMPLVRLPVFMDIPENPAPALQLFIGVLREALVYKTH